LRREAETLESGSRALPVAIKRGAPRTAPLATFKPFASGS
jgi:hypothetical protein